MVLDREHPQGSPNALRCRWCREPKYRHERGALLCRTCDGPVHLLKLKEKP